MFFWICLHCPEVYSKISMDSLFLPPQELQFLWMQRAFGAELRDFTREARCRSSSKISLEATRTDRILGNRRVSKHFSLAIPKKQALDRKRAQDFYMLPCPELQTLIYIMYIKRLPKDQTSTLPKYPCAEPVPFGSPCHNWAQTSSEPALRMAGKPRALVREK